MLGAAKKSPATRKVSDLDKKVSRLEKYEAWGKVKPLDIAALTGPSLWREYMAHWEKLQKDLSEAQETAEKVKKALQLALAEQKRAR